MRRYLTFLLILLLSVTTLACGDAKQSQSVRSNAPIQNQIKSGRYPVQQATYNDSDGIYTLMLLDTPPGSTPTYRTDKLQMARLTDEEIKQGEKTAVQINGDQAEMYLTEDFKIEYVHNVTELKDNPQTGQREPVVVRQESSFWTPFAGALAGQALGSLLFRPQYYVPPVYSGGGMSGYGGYGSSYGQAVNSYRSRYNSAPVVEKNRQTLRTTGNIRRSPSSSFGSKTNRKSSGSGFGSKANIKPSYNNSTKSSGSGFGSSRLRSSGSSSPRRSSSGSFGSSRSSSRSRSRR